MYTFLFIYNRNRFRRCHRWVFKLLLDYIKLYKIKNYTAIRRRCKEATKLLLNSAYNDLCFKDEVYRNSQSYIILYQMHYSMQ